MPTETLQIVIEAQNRSAGAFRQATSEVTDLSNVLRGLQGASRELDLFGALPGRLGTQVSYIRSAVSDITRAFGDVKGMGGGSVGEQLAGMGYKLSDDVLKLNADLLQTGAASTVAASGLSALTPIAVMGGVALAGVALAAGKAAIELGDAGQIAVQTERKFAAFSGGTAQAADNLAVMRAETDNGLAAMDAMGASSMLLSMGLADSGAKAAELTRMAMMLGPAWRDAQTNIQDFTMLLANQSIRRLDQFGLSVEGVRAKQQELMDQGFAKDIAFTNAVLEIGATKMLQLEKAGVVAATGSRQLEAAWKDLRMEISKPFAEPVSELEKGIAEGLRKVNSFVKTLSNDPSTRLGGMKEQLAGMVEKSIAIRDQPSLIPAQYRMDYVLLQADIRKLRKEIEELDSTSLAGITSGFRQLPDTIDRANSAMLNLVHAVQRLPDSIDMEVRIRQTMPYTVGPLRPPSEYESSFMGNSAGVSQDNFDRILGNIRGETRVVQDAWTGAAKSTENAFDKAASAVASHFDKAVSASIGLRDFRPGGAGGMSGPGANGAFEDIYRLQAWLTDGSWGNIAEKYGIKDKAQGADLIKKFQTGLWDESVTKMIDEDKIKAAVLTDKQAEAFKKAFAEKIAGATGVGTDSVGATIWGGDYTNSAAQTSKMTDTGQGMGGMLITGIKKAEPDLWQAGYNAAMAMQAGWNAAQSGKKPSDNTTPPPPGSGPQSVTESMRKRGVQE